MPRRNHAIAAVLALLGATALVVFGTADDQHTAGQVGPSAQGSAESAPPGVRGTRDAPGPDTARPADTRRSVAQPEGVPLADQVVVRGRCLAYDTGAPLAGCEVSLGATGTEAPPPRVRSAPDGRFELGSVPPGPGTAKLTVSGTGRAKCSAWLDLPAPGAVELGDLRLRAAREVRGRVRDQHGAPYSGLRVEVAGQLDHRFSFALRAETASDGTFAFPERLPHGAWRLTVASAARRNQGTEDRGPVLITPDTLVIRELGEPSWIEVTGVRGHPIHGVVVDQRGEAVHDAGVVAVAGAWRSYPSSTDADGRFELMPETSAPSSVRLEVLAAPRHDGALSAQTFSWGAEGVRLVVRRVDAGTLALEVVEAATRIPIPGYYRVHVWSEEDETFGLQAEGRSYGDAAGKITVEGVRPGRNLVTVSLPAAWLRLDPVRFVAGRGTTTTLVLAAKRAAEIRACVVDPGGVPLSGVRVELLAPCAGGRILEATSLMVPEDARPSFRSNEIRGTVIDEHWTDARGLATLHGPPGVSDLALRACRAAGSEAFRLGVGAGARSEPWRLVLPAGACLEGTLRPASVTAGASICLRKPGDDARMMESRWLTPEGSEFREDWAIDSAGRFKIEELPAGTWEVVLGTGSGFHSTAAATVELVDGKTTFVELDARALAPGRIRGRVLQGGHPPPHGKLALIGEVSPGSWFERDIGVDDEGWFVADGVPPARYAVRRTWSEVGRPASSSAGSRPTCELLSGADVTHVFHLETSRLHVRLSDHDGHPPPVGTACRIWAGHTWTWQVTDRDGRFVVDHAPETVEFQWLGLDPDGADGAEHRLLGGVKLKPGEQSIELRVSLPLRRKP